MSLSFPVSPGPQDRFHTFKSVQLHELDKVARLDQVELELLGLW